MGRKTTLGILQVTTGEIALTVMDMASLLIATQNIAITTNNIKVKIDNMQQNVKCRLCGNRDEMVNHISEGNNLAQKCQD